MPDQSNAGFLDPQELRRRAVERLESRHGKIVQMPAERVEKLVHELEVYQVELEVQNEELRRAQMEAAETLRRYRNLYDAAPVGYLSLDTHDNIIQANQAASHLCSREFDELEGKAVQCLLAPEDRDKLWLMLRHAAHTGLPQSGEFRLQRPGTSARWVHADASALDPRLGPDSGFRMTLTDINGRMLAEEALRQGEARLAQAIRVAGLGIFEYDHGSKRLDYSLMMREISGWGDQEEITLEKVLERVAPEDREALARAIDEAGNPAGTGSLAMEYRVVTAAGGVRWLSVRAETFFQGMGRARRPVRTIGAAQEVTERNGMLQALTQARERLRQYADNLEQSVQDRTVKLQRTVEELEHFSHTITHDMRAPLRALSGFSDILLKAYSNDQSSAGQDYARRIKQAAERMDRLITDALSYTKTLRTEIDLEGVDTGALLHGLVESYPQFQPPSAEILIDEPIPWVAANEAALTQIFSNLLGNAVKFVPEGAKPKVRVRAEPRGAFVRLWFEDNGKGIPAQYQEVIWGMFQKLDKEIEGKGIGLALVKKVVERLKGRVGVESEPGRGSRFWVELRLSETITSNRYGESSDPLRGG